ncbi:MAG: PA14 domain-containing protein [Phycisphaerae bacterium]
MKLISATVASALLLLSATAVLAAPAPNGLYGEAWNQPEGEENIIETLSQAETIIGSRSADSTFTATAIDYATSGSEADTTLLEFLDGNATDVTSDFANMRNAVFRFSGYLEILGSMDEDTSDPDIDVTLQLQSDDGSFLYIDGVQVIDNGGTHGPETVSTTESFASAGLVPIEIIYWNSEYSGGSGGGEVEFQNGDGEVIPNSQLSLIPEPATLALLSLGLPVLLRRKRR